MAQINRFSHASYGNGNVLEMPLKFTIPLNYIHLLMPIRESRGGCKSHRINALCVYCFAKHRTNDCFILFFLHLLHIVLTSVNIHLQYFRYINAILLYVLFLNEYRLF